MTTEVVFSPLLPPEGTGSKLKEIYAPIARDLERLDVFLRAEFQSVEPFICQLLSHIARFRGKQIRPAILLLTCKLTGPEVTPDHVKIAAVIELIHTATLVHDDILDDAALRRNVETIHRRWGERAGVSMRSRPTWGESSPAWTPGKQRISMNSEWTWEWLSRSSTTAWTTRGTRRWWERASAPTCARGKSPCR